MKDLSMDDVQRLKNELDLLKEQFKKKCEKLKKANEKIRYLTPKRERRNAWEEIKHLERSMLIDLTSNLDKFIYKVTYKYDDKNYIEEKVESFGTKWLKKSLLMHMAHKHNIVLYDYEVKIISAEKLW